MTKPKQHSLQHKKETRIFILQKAKELFMIYGYRAVSTRKIANACGITQPALYHHFSGKEELYVEVIRSISTKTRETMIGTVEKQLRIDKSLYEVVYYMIANHPDNLAQMFHDIQHELQPASQQLIEKWWYEAYLTPVIHIFEQGYKEGYIQSPEGSVFQGITCARLLMNLIDQSMSTNPFSQGKQSNSEESIENLTSSIISFFLYGYASPKLRGEET